jgi:HAD superfamily hydrolase (TIGR01509 family)
MKNTKWIIFDLGNVIYIDTETVFDEVFGKELLSKEAQEEYIEMAKKTERGELPTTELLKTIKKTFNLLVTTKQLDKMMIETALIKPMWELLQRLKYQTAKYLGISYNGLKMFNSAEIGMRKPEPDIYKYVTKELGANPKDIVFIDDRKYNLIEPKKLGWKTILFNGDMAKLSRSLKKLGIEAKI